MHTKVDRTPVVTIGGRLMRLDLDRSVRSACRWTIRATPRIVRHIDDAAAQIPPGERGIALVEPGASDPRPLVYETARRWLELAKPEMVGVVLLGSGAVASLPRALSLHKQKVYPTSAYGRLSQRPRLFTMTLLVGFSIRGVQCLIADAALTSDAPFSGESPQSSFGEQHRATDHGYVREGAIKLFQLGSGYIGGYCGRVSAGLSALQLLKYRLLAQDRIHDALMKAQERVRGAKLLISGPDEIGAIRRWYVDEDRIEEDYLDEVRRILGSGSASEEQRTFVDNALNSILPLADPRIADQHLLTAAIVAIQAHGQRVDLVRHAVGGTFWGIGVGKQSLILQRDILYILFDQDESLATRITVQGVWPVISGQRGHIAFAWRVSLRDRGLRVFVGDVNYVTDDEVSAMAPTVMDLQPYYLVFVERRTGSVLICVREDLGDESLFAIKYLDGSVNFTCARIVQERLRGFPSSRAGLPREVPFDVIFSGSPPETVSK